MMNKAWKTAVVGTLLVGAAFGAYGSASASTAAGAEELRLSADGPVTLKQGTLPEGKNVIVFHRHAGGILLNPVHERNYLLLLVKTYDPQSEAAWKAAFEERKQVEAGMPKPSEPPKPGTMEKKVIIKKQGAGGEEAGGTVFIGGKDAPVEIRLHKQAADDILINKEPAEGSMLQDQLAEALEAGKDDEVKTLLPKLLEQYGKDTAELKSMGDKLRKLQAENN